MLKRIVSILLIIPAVCIILAHAVIPHHHHNDQVCFDVQNCHETHACPSEQHAHDLNCGIPYNEDLPKESESSDCCFLQENLVFHPGPQRLELTCPSLKVNYYQGIQFVVLTIALHTGQIHLPDMLPFRQKPFITTHSAKFAASTPGLRAPPSC